MNDTLKPEELKALADACRIAGQSTDQLAQRDARIKELEACCAVMREALRTWKCAPLSDPGTINRCNEKGNDALSTDCGKGLLVQHEAWRKALEIIASGPETHEATILARNALNPTA